MENQMKNHVLVLLLLCLALGGCFYGPGGGYDYRGGAHGERQSHGDWGR
jgi:hypothetical protein